MLWVLRRWIIRAFVDILSLYDVAGCVLEFGGIGGREENEHIKDYDRSLGRGVRSTFIAPPSVLVHSSRLLHILVFGGFRETERTSRSSMRFRKKRRRSENTRLSLYFVLSHVNSLMDLLVFWGLRE
jgi:hypothetical protein